MLISTGKRLLDKSGRDMTRLEKPLLASDWVEPLASIRGELVALKALQSTANFIGEPTTVAFRASARGEGFDPSFNHVGDLEYWLRILLGGNYLFIPETLCGFRRHDDGRSWLNAVTLLSGADWIKLLANYNAFLLKHDIDREEIPNTLLGGLSEQVRSILLAEGGGLLDYADCDTLVDAAIGSDKIDMPPEQIISKLALELKSFQSLSLHALNYIGALLERSDLTRSYRRLALEQQQVIDALEKEIRDILSSRSWHITRILRDLNPARAILSDYEELDSLFGRYQAGDLQSIVSSQKHYLRYLRRLKGRLLNSRSWAVTKPLRALENLGQRHSRETDGGSSSRWKRATKS